MQYQTPSTSTSSAPAKKKRKLQGKTKVRTPPVQNRRKGDRRESDPAMEKMYSKLDL
jgi:hypothetical protein